MRLRGPLTVVAAAAFVLAPTAIPAAANELIGTVGPGFTITLKQAGGADVLQLDPGTYSIEVSDLAPDHNFHLFGPGVNQSTDVAQTGTVNWSVNLVEGRYTLVCDPHSTDMRRDFVVGNPPAAPPPKPPLAAVPKLLATVGPRNTISLRSGSRGRAPDSQAGHVLDHGARPLDAAQLPPRRQGREPQVDAREAWARSPGA